MDSNLQWYKIKIKKCNKNKSCHDNAGASESRSFTVSTQGAVQKTKKNKQEKSTIDKKQLWSIFDKDKQPTIEITEIVIDQSDRHIKSTTSNDKMIEIRPDVVGSIAISEKKEDASSAEYKHDADLCITCNSILVIMEDGYPVCSKCGIIYNQTLNYSPEWRYYGADDKNTADPTRCGNPINPLLQQSSYGCTVLCTNKSSYEMKKIKKWTEWQSMPHKEKTLYDEFKFITIMAQNAGIPKIFIDDAIHIHKDISEQKMFRGMNRDCIKSASIYISCRLNGCPRTAHEIAEIFKLDKASATNGCSMAVNILHNIERSMDVSQQTDLCITTPILFIDRYCSKLNINQELTMLSKFVAKKIEDNNIINDNTPNSIAAGIIYFIAQICNLNITKQDIKVVCGVSEVTINKCYKKLECIKEDLVPSCIIEKYM